MSSPLPTGTLINGYRIDAVLSDEGNFAIVYLAYDTNAARLQNRRDRIAGRLGRWKDRYGVQASQTRIDAGPLVALKEYIPQRYGVRKGGKTVAAANGQGDVFAWGRERFVRESEFLAEHSHPNVVAVFDRFSANNTEYYVMERLTGGSLNDLISRHGGQDERDVRAWLEPILAGLGSVERRNADHLDISPTNILFRTPGGDPVLVDFGAARISGSTPTHKSRLVVNDPFAGPEKYQRTSSSLNAASDVYSLAATAFCALTGTPPTSSLNRKPDMPALEPNAYSQAARKASPKFLQVLETACNLDPLQRFRDSDSFLAAISGSVGGQGGAKEGTNLVAPGSPQLLAVVLLGVALLALVGVIAFVVVLS